MADFIPSLNFPPGGFISFGDGSAASPSIRFTNDATTGIYRPGTSRIGFTGNGIALGQFDGRATTSGVIGLNITPSAPTIVSAAGTTWSGFGVAATTITLTGGVLVTAMNGAGAILNAPTITSAAATTVSTASTLYVSGAPIAAGAGPVTITNRWAIHSGGAMRLDGNLSLANQATNIVGISNTAASVQITDGTTAILAVDSRNTVSGIGTFAVTGPNQTIASAAAANYQVAGVTLPTVTWSGATNITSPIVGIVFGVNGNIAIGTSGAGLTITRLSVMSTTGPQVGANVTLTTGIALEISNPGVPAGILSTLTGLYVNNLTRGTTNFALSFQNNVEMRAALDFVGTANVASMWRVTDGTTALFALDSRNTVTGVTTATFVPPASTSIASAAGVTYTVVGIPAYTITVTGVTTVTAMAGLSLNIGSPTVTNTSAGLTLTTVSAVIINGPLPAGNATFTNSFALDIPTFVTNGTTAAGLRVVAPSGAGSNFALQISGTVNFFAASTIQTTVGALTIAPVSGSNLALTVAGAGNIALTFGTGTMTGGVIGTGWSFSSSPTISGAATLSGAITFSAANMAVFVSAGALQIGGASSTTANQFFTATQGAASTQMFIGNASINVTSDLRVKGNVQPYSRNALALLRDLPVIEYDMEDMYRPFGGIYSGRYVGLGAQDIYRAMPWAVNTQGGQNCARCLMGATCHEHGPWTMRADLMMGVMVKAHQEADERLAVLEAENILLEARLAAARL